MEHGAGDTPSAQLRLAVAFTGGVSLAVWMGGMAREMNLLLAAARVRRREQVNAPGTAESQQVRDSYQSLLRLLDMDCTLDILCGTSAGGVNAAVLGLANVQRFDLGGLRDLWFQHGNLENLLRDPSAKQPPSLLDGDNGLFTGLSAGFRNLSEKGLPPLPGDPTEVFITTTLLTGEPSRFTDEYGTLVRDTDHHGLFRFTSDQLARNVSALAFAARCSASYPGAFEPALVPIGRPGPDGHPDMKPFAVNISTSQFAADGGLLANRPLGPALQAVFDRKSDREVRRVLAYVVPTVGGPATSRSSAGGTPLPLAGDGPPGSGPALAPALVTDLRAMMSQSISTELAAITTHNDQVRARRAARYELARLGASLDELAGPLYQTYRGKRADYLARAASESALSRLAAADVAQDGRPLGFGDGDRVITAARTAVLDKLPGQLPGDSDGLLAAGREALDDAETTVLSLLNEAYQLLTSAEQRQCLGELKRLTGTVMPHRAPPSPFRPLDPPGSPTASGPPAPRPSPEQDAAQTAAAMLDADMQVSPAHPQPWQELGAVVAQLRILLPDPSDGFLRAVLAYLTGDQAEPSPEAVAGRLFRLYIARYVLQPGGIGADQELELVQMSADTRTLLDRRTLAAEKLTGLQLHHFGAFYKGSWRANDWMWGRLDGAGWLVHLLLDPRRLLLLADAAINRAAFLTDLRDTLTSIAGAEPPPGIWEPFTPQPGIAGAAKAPAELAYLEEGCTLPTPVSLPTTAMWVAAGLQRHIAAEELAHVAQQATADSANGHRAGAARDFVAAYWRAAGAPAVRGMATRGTANRGKATRAKAIRRTATGGTATDDYPSLPVDRAQDLLQACRVSAERLAQEVGSARMTQTLTQAAAVSVNLVDQGRAVRSLRPVLTGAHTATMLAYRAVRVGPVARYPLLVGLGLVAVGVLASTSTLSLLSVFGLGAVLAGILLVAVGAGRQIGRVAAAVALGAGVVIAAAGFMPAARDRLFPWLEKTALPDLAKHPVWWAIVVVLLLLPPVWTLAGLLRRVVLGQPNGRSQPARPPQPRRRRRLRPAPASASPITGAPAGPDDWPAHPDGPDTALHSPKVPAGLR
jgi:predicted acylesterase/phospholipase RssA